MGSEFCASSQNPLKYALVHQTALLSNDSSHLIAAYNSFIDPVRMKVADLQRTVYLY